MEIKKFIFNLFAENTYILYDKSKQAIIIDPGCYSDDEKKVIVEFIEEKQLIPVVVLNTHCHIDHILGVNFLKNYYNIDFWANKKDEFLINNVSEIEKVYGFELDKNIVINKNISATDEINFGESNLKVLEVPGHSMGHLAFYSPEDKFVITGDVLFKDTIGRTDLPGGDLDQLMNSIFTQILPLGDEVEIFPGHGPSTTIGLERKDNPFL